VATFFEIQYFDGGFKTELVPSGPRPTLLPEPSGPRSNELEFHEGGFAVELLWSSYKSHRVIWIGAFTSGFDLQHGARGNYCGVGVWLIDLAPLYVERILNNLYSLAKRVSEDGAPGSELLTGLENALQSFDELGWCVPIDRWPPAFLSNAFDSSDDGSSVYLSTPNPKALDLKLVAADILHQFTSKTKQVSRPQRRLYLMQQSSKLGSQKLVELDYASALSTGEQAIAEFCRVTASSSAQQNELLETQRRTTEEFKGALASARTDLETQSRRADGLAVALQASEQQRSAMQETFAAVRQFTSDSDDTIVTGFAARLEEIRGIVSESQNRLGEIDGRVAKLPDRIFQAASQASRRGNATGQEPISPEPILAEGLRRGTISKWLLAVAFAVMFAALTAVGTAYLLGDLRLASEKHIEHSQLPCPPPAPLPVLPLGNPDPMFPNDWKLPWP
jgi:hypothetical protein